MDKLGARAGAPWLVLALALLLATLAGSEQQVPTQAAPQLSAGSLGIALARQRASMLNQKSDFPSGFSFGQPQAQQAQQAQTQPPKARTLVLPSMPVPSQLAAGFGGASPQGMFAGAPTGPVAARVGEMPVAGFESASGGSGTRPATPARPFIGKLAEMLCGILGGGLRAFGDGVRTVTGASGASLFSGILGMMGYAGPYGYDPFGPGQSQDPFSQSAPETNSCYQLLETWLRQCSAQPEAFLQIAATTTTTTSTSSAQSSVSSSSSSPSSPHAPASPPSVPAARSGVVFTLGSKGVSVHRSEGAAPDREPLDAAVSMLELELEQNPAPSAGTQPLSPQARAHAAHLIAQIGEAMGMKQSNYAPQAVGQEPSVQDKARGMLQGLRGAGSRPMAPMAPNDPDTPAPPEKPGMFDQIMSGAGMTPAMGGLVSQTLGPDTYNPWVADGAEPDEFQISGPEKCTRMMNNWLYKCALSPL